MMSAELLYVAEHSALRRLTSRDIEGPSGFTNSRRPIYLLILAGKRKAQLVHLTVLDDLHIYLHLQPLTLWRLVLSLQLEMPTPEQSSPRSPLRAATRPSRVLACVLCQHRKVKCDRGFPCANCVRAQVQCVPATQVRRRRRFPERELLERLRGYEDLLRQNDIQFQPLHHSVVETSSSRNARSYDTTNDGKLERNSQEEGTPASETKYEAKSVSIVVHQCLWLTFCRSFWGVMNQLV